MLQPSEFQSLANGYGYNVTQNQAVLCADQYVGTIASFHGKSLFQRKQTDHIPADLPGLLILILESPHIHEYEVSPPVPANGNTGAAIRQNFLGILNALPQANGSAGALEFESYGVILVNAVQHQCSFGLTPANLVASDVFTKIWKHSGMMEFRTRLKSYLSRFPDAKVINACTRGPIRKADQLRVMVEAAVLSEIPEGSFVRLCHPSSWALSGRNRLPGKWTVSGEARSLKIDDGGPQVVG